MIWTQYDWLNKFYIFCVPTVLNNFSMSDLSIDAYQHKLVLYKLSILFNSHLTCLYVSNKMEHFSYKGGCGEHMCILRHLKKNWFGLHINGFRYLLYKAEKPSVRLSVRLHFWNAHNSVVSASIETGLARNESCIIEED